MSRLDELIEDLSSLPDPSARDKVRETIAEVLSLHRRGIARMLELRDRDAWVTDDVIAPLLVLHDLHPADLVARVEGAMSRVEGTMLEGGARARLLGIDQGRIEVDYVPPQGSPATAQRLKTLLHDTLLEAAPDAVSIDVIESTLIDPTTLRRETRA